MKNINFLSETLGGTETNRIQHGISIRGFESGGRICHHSIVEDGQENSFGVAVNKKDGMTSFGRISAVGKFTNNEITYLCPENGIYRGKLESKIGFENVLEYIDQCEDCFNCNVYTPNGENQTFVIPNDVNRIFVQMWGAGGSSGRYQANKDAGGAGGYAEGYIDVVPGQKLIIGVGETTNGTDINTRHIPAYSIGGTAGYGGVGEHKGAGAGWYEWNIFKFYICR